MKDRGVRMGRDALLREKKEKEAVFRDLAGIKYELFDDDGKKAGYVEYSPQSDTLLIDHGAPLYVNGSVLRSLRDILNKQLDERQGA